MNVTYPYHFVQKFEEPRWGSVNDFLLYRLLYTFTSPRSHQTYWVWVEVYEHDFYAIKFHLKSHRDSPRKFNLMTGLGEPFPVVNTCVNIMQEIAAMNENASFGFIGEASGSETHENTRRFRFYRRFMATNFGLKDFLHIANEAKSSYMLIRRRVFEKDPDIVEKIYRGLTAMYDYFD